MCVFVLFCYLFAMPFFSPGLNHLIYWITVCCAFFCFWNQTSPPPPLTVHSGQHGSSGTRPSENGHPATRDSPRDPPTRPTANCPEPRHPVQLTQPPHHAGSALSSCAYPCPAASYFSSCHHLSPRTETSSASALRWRTRIVGVKEGSWTCLKFLKMFHLSSERLLQFCLTNGEFQDEDIDNPVDLEMLMSFGEEETSELQKLSYDQDPSLHYP
ncbi:uncharacterized protein LOC132868895 isoform X1 [Neoarius graeffei]|uniref:uncharacterized protein LOC132868895 isoform X1 n=1 Tax=Neoarius graeffei TaxID=443677 RepID=UPI00298D0718|nr:uncharacterized protein LOC132868895 isoform X1 [Neoarius graeffei]